MVLRTAIGLVTLVMDSPAPLMTIGSARAFVMRNAIARLIGTTAYAARFRHKGRGVCVDGHPSNRKAEELLFSQRPGWPACLFLCEIHLLALVFKEAFQSLYPSVVRGMLYTSLCLTEGEAMKQFRNALYIEIVTTLDIMNGAPDASAVAYRQRMMQLFMKSFSSISTALAACMPNGEWRIRSRVKFYPPHGLIGPVSKKTKHNIVHFLAVSLLKAFVPLVLKLFAVHHWTGLDIALDQQGALEACHYLFSRAAKRYLLKNVAAKKDWRRPVAELFGLGDAARPVPVEDVPLAELAPVDPDPVVEPAGEPADPAIQPQKSETDWAAVNAKRRQVMTEFWSSSPLWLLVILRLILEPLRALMEMKFKTGSWTWGVRQRAKAARAAARGGDQAEAREYRGLLSANNVEESKAMLEVKRIITESEPWLYVLDPEPQALTVHGRCLGFRMATRAGAGLYESLIYRHQQYPFPTLRLPREPELAPSIRRDATDTTCVGGYCDPWTRALVQQFPTERDLVSADCRAVIFLVLLISWTCTSTLETLHATIRRLIKSLSVHTHQTTWHDVNATWLMVTYRRMKERCLMLRGQHVQAKPRHQVEAPIPRKEKRTKTKRMTDGTVAPQGNKPRKVGGAWRAFMRQKFTGCGVKQPFKYGNMADATQQFHTLAPDDAARLKEQGKAGTAAGRLKRSRWKSSFGPRPSETAAKQARDLRKALQNHVHDVHEGVVSLAALADIQRASGGVQDVSRFVKASRGVLARREVDRMRADAADMQAYEEGPGRACVEAVQTQYPEVCSQTVVAFPTEEGHALWIHAASDNSSAQAVSLTSHYNAHYGKADTSQSNVDKAWMSMNRTITEDECDHMDDVPQHKRKCNAVGVCLCTRAGKRLLSFCTGFQSPCCKPFRAIPHVRPPGPKRRTVGLYVLRCRSGARFTSARYRGARQSGQGTDGDALACGNAVPVALATHVARGVTGRSANRKPPGGAYAHLYGGFG